jgi:tetratricopeptide (TPR) repeat protein
MRSPRLSSTLLVPATLATTLACTPTPAEDGAAAKQSPTPNQAPSGSLDTPEAAPPEDTNEGPEAAEAPKQDTSHRAPKPKIDEAAKLRKQLLALLNEGRALTKKQEYEAGMAKYREALEIDASDVSVLAELGWAAFKSGDLELAHRTTVQALKFVRDDDKKRGMLLYNLGRIEEDRNNVSEAIAHYEASLAARPNHTVESRLEALEATQNQMASAGGELEGPDRAATGGLAPLGWDLGDLAAACKVVETARCEDYTLSVDESCTCKPTLIAAPGVDDSWGLVRLGDESESMQVAWFPVVETDKGWTVFSEVLYTYNPGAFGIYEEARIEPSTVEPLLASGTQLAMKFAKSRMDRDMGLNEIESEDYEGMVICARFETGAYCTHTLLSSYEYVREVEFPGQDEEIAGGAIEHEGLPIEMGFEASFAFRDGKLVVNRTKVSGGFDREEVWGTIARILPPGEHPLAALLGLPG